MFKCALFVKYIWYMHNVSNKAKRIHFIMYNAKKILFCYEQHFSKFSIYKKNLQVMSSRMIAISLILFVEEKKFDNIAHTREIICK